MGRRCLKQPKKRISLTLDADVIEKVKNLAENDGRTISQYINRVLKLHVDATKENGGTMYSRM